MMMEASPVIHWIEINQEMTKIWWSRMKQNEKT